MLREVGGPAIAFPGIVRARLGAGRRRRPPQRPVIARGIADAFRDADLLTAAVTEGWHGDLDAALTHYGRQRDQCAIPLSDANLAIARLDMPTAALGAAWFQLNQLEQALDDPAAIAV